MLWLVDLPPAQLSLDLSATKECADAKDEPAKRDAHGGNEVVPRELCHPAGINGGNHAEMFVATYLC